MTMLLILILLQIIFQIPAHSGKPTLFEFEVVKPTSDCRVDSVRIIIPYSATEIDTVFAVHVDTKGAKEYWQIYLVGFRCGEHQLLTQAFIYSFHGGQPLITPGLFDVKIYPKLSFWQRSYMRMRNLMSRSSFLRRQGWTEIDTMYFCKE